MGAFEKFVFKEGIKTKLEATWNKKFINNAD